MPRPSLRTATVRRLTALPVMSLAALALTATGVGAQAAVENTRAATGAATTRSARDAFVPERLARLDAWMDSMVRLKRLPNAVVLLMKDGQVAHEYAVGVRDVATGVPVRSDDLFRIASQTKAITSLAAMILWEEGRFQLDDPVERYLPSFAKPTVLTKFNEADSTYETRPARGRMTVRQLFTHTSGLDYADIGSPNLRAIYAKAGITAIGRGGDVLGPKIDALGALPLANDPGERFRYSLSTDVLGRLVEVWSGMSLDEFMRTRIFEPLGMNDTYFSVPASKRDRLVTLHEMKDGRLVPMHEGGALGMHPDQPAMGQTYHAGGAGLVSTVRDYGRFLQMFLNGGELDGTRIIGRKTVELMLLDHSGSLDANVGLGFGLETASNDYRSALSPGSFQWGGAFNTTYWADPAEGLVAIIFTNTTGPAPGTGDPLRTFTYSALR